MLLPLKELTDVKKGLEMVQESLVHALKEEGHRNSSRGGDHNILAIQTVPADDEHPADTIAQVFKGYKLHDRTDRLWWWFITYKAEKAHSKNKRLTKFR